MDARQRVPWAGDNYSPCRPVASLYSPRPGLPSGSCGHAPVTDCSATALRVDIDAAARTPRLFSHDAKGGRPFANGSGSPSVSAGVFKENQLRKDALVTHIPLTPPYSCPLRLCGWKPMEVICGSLGGAGSELSLPSFGKSTKASACYGRARHHVVVVEETECYHNDEMFCFFCRSRSCGANACL